MVGDGDDVDVLGQNEDGDADDARVEKRLRKGRRGMWLIDGSCEGEERTTEQSGTACLIGLQQGGCIHGRRK